MVEYRVPWRPKTRGNASSPTRRRVTRSVSDRNIGRRDSNEEVPVRSAVVRVPVIECPLPPFAGVIHIINCLKNLAVSHFHGRAREREKER